MKLKRVAALALAGVMVFSLGACGGGGNDGGGESGGGGGDLSVMIWDTYQEAGLKEILADFTEETGIGAEIQVVPWNEYWTLLEAGAQGGDGFFHPYHHRCPGRRPAGESTSHPPRPIQELCIGTHSPGIDQRRLVRTGPGRALQIFQYIGHNAIPPWSFI